MTPQELPLLLLSGMAADERLLAPQAARFPDLTVVPWIDPLPRESLRDYAARLARRADPGRRCVVGGASFGGIVALEMATHLQVAACVLIGSVRSPAELSIRWRALRPLARLGPNRLGVAAGLLARWGHPFLRPGVVGRLRRLSRPDAGFVRWAMCAVLRWTPSPASRRVHVYHIHGENDRTLPVGLTRPDVVVPAGGHALTLTNPAAVNEYLSTVREWARQGIGTAHSV